MWSAEKSVPKWWRQYTPDIHKYISPPTKDCERKLRHSHTAASLMVLINRNLKLEQNF